MLRLKEKILRELGDQGADTLRRYFAQIQYTVYLCIQMLRDEEEIKAVAPEAIEDIVVIRKGCSEFHQVKTRNESVGSWTFSEVLPILCKQYANRRNFPNCSFHFVSNQIADRKEQRQYGGSLYNLKYLLDIKHNGDAFTDKELKNFEEIKNALVPLIQREMAKEYSEMIDDDTAVDLLCRTTIDTECPKLYNPGNVEELNFVLERLYPGISHTVRQVSHICDNLILLVIRKIIETDHIQQRFINHVDVLACRNASVISNSIEGLDLNALPGKTVLEKKTLFGGFDFSELPLLHKQKALAEYFKRYQSNIGRSQDIEQLIVDLLDSQWECRDVICRVNNVQNNPGPRILAMLRPKLNSIMQNTAFGKGVNNSLCLGLLWGETDNCYAYWHSLKSSDSV